MSSRKVIAKVGGQELYQWQLDETLESYAFELLRKTVPELSAAEYDDSVEKALEKLIGGELFYLEAVDAGYTASDEEAGRYLDEVYSANGDDGRLEGYLDYRGIERTELEAVARKLVIKDKFVSTLVGRIPQASEEEVEKYYQKIRNSLFMPPRVEFHVLCIENPSEEAAARFRAAFSNVEAQRLEPEFALQIMQDFAGSTADARFGMVKDRALDELPGETVRLIREIDQGCFSPLFQSPDEISILYMVRKEMNRPMADTEAREEAGRYLNLVRLRKVLDAYVGSLREKYAVEVLL